MGDDAVLVEDGGVMTLDHHGKQVVAVACSYAISILERAPANWLRPGLLFDLHTLLERLTDDEPNPALKVARAHAKKLLKETARLH
jgi:hypothetical protein